MKNSSVMGQPGSKIHVRKKVAGGATGATLGAAVAGPIGALVGGALGTLVGSAAEQGTLAKRSKARSRAVKRRTVRSRAGGRPVAKRLARAAGANRGKKAAPR